MFNDQLLSTYNVLTPAAIQQSFIMAAVNPSSYRSQYEEPRRSGTGASGSSSEGTNDIIPGGGFEGFELQDSGTQPQGDVPLSGNVNRQQTFHYPQTPQQPTGGSFGSGATSTSPQSCMPHNVPTHAYDGGIGSAIRNIDERTKRISMAASPLTSASYSPSKPSPLAMQAMQPSAFRMMGVPMTPTTTHLYNARDDDGNTQPRPILFAASQPVNHFTPGPPLQGYATENQNQSMTSLMGASPRGMGLAGEPQVPYYPAGFDSSDSANSVFTSSSSVMGYPSTPVHQHFRSSLAYGDNLSFPVKLEEGNEEVAIFGQHLATTQQARSQQQYRHAPSSSMGGSLQNHFTQRQYHPYRTPQSEPLNRVASSSIAQHCPPPTPPIFAFNQSLPRPNTFSTPVSAQPQDMFSLPNPTSAMHMNSRHHHTGSLEFAVPHTPVAFRERFAERPPLFQSMSLPNHPGSGFPTSPEGRSVQTESDDFDEDGVGMARSPSAMTPTVEGFALQQSPRSPKKHICQLCGKAFNRPSSLNTHMSVHTGAKPYQCPKRDCARKFSVSSNLRRHMKTHEVKDQERVAQMTSRELADSNDFEMEEQVHVKAEPEEATGMVNVRLQEDEQELVNGSIVYDEDGRSYRYYASESEYHQAAQQQLDTPFQAQAPLFDSSAMSGHSHTHLPVPPTHEPTTAADPSFPLDCHLGNAAPPMSGLPDSFPPDASHAAFSGFGLWTRDGAPHDLSEGISLPRPLALGNAGFSI